MSIGKMRVLALLAAGVVFALPWLELECSGQPFIRQSGIQIVYGGQSLAPEMQKQMDQMKEMGGGQQNVNANQEGPPKSILLGVAALLVILSLLAAFAALRDDNPKAGVGSGFLAALALSLIIIQLLIGFPIERKIKEDIEEQQKKTAASQTTEQAQMNAMASTMTKNMFKVKKLPWFYLELVLLAIPGLLAAASMRQMRDEEDASAEEEDEE